MAQPVKRADREPTAEPPVDIVSFRALPRAAAPARRWPWRGSSDMYVWAAIALVLGVLFTAQLRSQPAPPPVDVSTPARAGAATIERLEAEQAALKLLIADLRKQITLQQEQAAKDKASFAEISDALKREQVLAGLAPLAGQGVKVTLDDSTVRTIPPNVPPDYYLVHDVFLRDVVNVLWAGGAEAISLNGERLVATTSVYCVGSTILVNSTRLSPPYVFLAIGDQESMTAALKDPTALGLLKLRVQDYDVQFKIEPQDEIKVPAYDGTMHTKYAQPGTAN